MSAGTTQVSVCQPTTTVCTACMSPVLTLGSVAFSSFSTIGTPATAEYTRAEMVRFVAVSAIGPTLTLAPAQTSPPSRMILPVLPVAPVGPAAMDDVSAPLKPTNSSGVASSNEASTMSPLTGGGTTGTVSNSCSWALALVLAMPPRSAYAPTATLTRTVPVLLGAGVTSSRYFMSLTLISTPGVPPVTATSLVAKVLPTDSLKVNVKVTGPVALALAVLSAITSVGATPSGTTLSLSPSSPPQAATSTDTARALADRANFFERWYMAVSLAKAEAKGRSAES